MTANMDVLTRVARGHARTQPRLTSASIAPVDVVVSAGYLFTNTIKISTYYQETITAFNRLPNRNRYEDKKIAEHTLKLSF